MRAQLSGDTDFAGFRAQARALLAADVPPDEVHWSTGAGNDDLFGGDDTPAAPPASSSPLSVPAEFLATCQAAALHRDPQRFALLYRILWRMAREPGLRHDPLDADVLLARRMAHAVGHDIHKMRAFVRFREVPDAQAPGGTRHVAWFEPDHHIVEANAPWFMRRFTQMHWAIMTPECCVQWDGCDLQFQPGAARDEAPPADAGERLWLTYYQSIFNPARLKLAMMRKEMPRRYWHNLPESVLIAPLAARAQERSGTMIEQPATEPQRRVRRIEPRVRDAQVGVTIASLDDLRDAAQGCRDCPIGAMATQAVAGEGPMRPALMVVGEQPGDQEDLQGRPFVGPAGELLALALAQAGIERSSLYLTNAVRHFKFELRGKRRIHKTPTQAEAQACAQWLEHEIRLVQPRALLALGATAARSLLGRPVAIQSERGQWHTRGDGVKVFVTWHPAALLRMEPAAREEAFAVFSSDLLQAAGSWENG